LEGAVHANAKREHDSLNLLAALFAQHGVEPFLESTSLLVGLLDQEGNLLSWNPPLDFLKQGRPDTTRLQDVLSLPSARQFTELLLTSIQQRIRTKGELEFTSEPQNEMYVCLLIPLPGQRVLLIGEPHTGSSELEAVTKELQRTKRILTMKETEIKAVIAQAKEVSHTDALTFIPNRLQIIGDLQREVILSDRYGTPLSISMVDIDHFKTINDTYGHIVGDEVLRGLAMELRQHIRYPDTIGRYGGEEFLIVLPHSALKAASEQAERLCRHVRSLLIKSGEQQIALTISIGVAQYKIHKEDWEACLSRADAALYQAKGNGRDQWGVSEDAK
jgi:diguanylate cyclase (GGDEF)-like protein